MKAIQAVLYVFGGLFMLAGILAFTPWHTVNDFMAWFGPVSYPDDPIVAYTVRNFFLVMFWYGVLLIAAVHNPVRHSQIVVILAGTCLSAAVLCFALGWRYGLPPFFYLDTASAGLVGILLLALQRKTA